MTDLSSLKNELRPYEWLLQEPAPKLILEALKLYGVAEKKGTEHNPEILSWAKELSLNQYNADEIPWCGLFQAIICRRAGKTVVKDPLWARNWLNYGEACDPHLGCVLVFERDGGKGHVGTYVAEDQNSYYVLGGNQGDRVCIVPISKQRLLEGGARAEYKTARPANARAIHISKTGVVSVNEA